MPVPPGASGMESQPTGIDMTRIYLFTAAVLWSAVNCTEASNTVLNRPTAPQWTTRSVPSTAVIAGRIRVTRDGVDEVVELRDVDRDVVQLSGGASSALASVAGGDVVVWGTFDPSPGFLVQEFKVVGMHGWPALDGVLEATAGGFAIRLSDGSKRVVAGLDSTCVRYLGARVWVIGWNEDTALQFGPIGAP